jgi:Photosynthetic reaction centre cytochrome C subunit
MTGYHRFPMRRLVELAATFAVLAVVVGCAAVSQQKAEPPRPDDFQFHNLQVLPQNVTREELITTMRKFAQALGVECQHCHAALPPGAPPPKARGHRDLDKPLDFASDAKTEKRSARTMMRMLAINRDYVSKVEDVYTTPSCWTCHRGKRQPDVVPSLPPDESEGH